MYNQEFTNYRPVTLLQINQGQQDGTIFMEMRNIICKAGTIKETAETNFCEIVLVLSNQI